jgi:transcriptional regulator with XRE-family HTH domain
MVAATFGTLLREHRFLAGLTQAALAERAGVSVRGIQHLEADETRPYRQTVQRLIAALHLAADERAELEAATRPAPRRPRAAQSGGPPAPVTLPTGTVTLLFADFAEPHPVGGGTGEAEARPAAASRPWGTVRETVERHGGALVRAAATPGEADGARHAAAFARASDAVRAASALQAAACDRSTDRAHEPRPRITVVTGEPDLHRDTYVGEVVGRGLRLLTTTAPGQIALSDATVALARAALGTSDVSMLASHHQVASPVTTVTDAAVAVASVPDHVAATATTSPDASGHHRRRPTRVRDALARRPHRVRALSGRGHRAPTEWCCFALIREQTIRAGRRPVPTHRPARR